MYNPLPECLTIKKSNVHGLGVFSIKFIKQEASLGITHVFIGSDAIRTPLGGFINHSEEPNCELRYCTQYGGCEALWVLRDIEAGEELTLKYSRYDPTKS